MTTPAEQYAAAKKRGSHPLTTEFIEQSKMAKVFSLQPLQVLERR